MNAQDYKLTGNHTYHHLLSIDPMTNTPTVVKKLDSFLIKQFVRQVITEDLGFGDITTDLCVPPESQCRGSIYAKEPEIVIAGLDICRHIFFEFDPQLTIAFCVTEGTTLQGSTGQKQLIGEIHGSTSSILKMERLALNMLSRMCGIATYTRKLAHAISNLPAILLDTRKTTPGLKIFDKYASLVGGAKNHRFHLSDGILIKENHITVSQDLTHLIKLAKTSGPMHLKVEVEVSSQEQLRCALEAGADIIMLDNMSLANMTACVKYAAGRVPLEASGNIDLANIHDVAKTGVDYISSSAMFRAPNSDLTLLLDPCAGE
ncbi:MAG: carboxylating nicotinate-nucleotide diphosphorylase [Proteobacteria bacterium]|nr:carboxylating nicotinate-nucleotide diphosphorylase [Pseudomonadota bacterium]